MGGFRMEVRWLGWSCVSRQFSWGKHQNNGRYRKRGCVCCCSWGLVGKTITASFIQISQAFVEQGYSHPDQVLFWGLGCFRAATCQQTCEGIRGPITSFFVVVWDWFLIFWVHCQWTLPFMDISNFWPPIWETSVLCWLHGEMNPIPQSKRTWSFVLGKGDLKFLFASLTALLETHKLSRTWWLMSRVVGWDVWLKLCTRWRCYLGCWNLGRTGVKTCPKSKVDGATPKWLTMRPSCECSIL